ncbi:MAG: hypothetical protein KF758_16820 [Anaerolineales bacterium]|nr:hypothetical protein [Anaerolineales bacterium]
MAFYLGKRSEDDWIQFQSVPIPTKQSHGHLYTSVIGPFKSKVGASYFARYGKNNPKICTAEDVERLARADPLMAAAIVEESMSAEELCIALECDAQEQYKPSSTLQTGSFQYKKIKQGVNPCLISMNINE